MSADHTHAAQPLPCPSAPSLLLLLALLTLSAWCPQSLLAEELINVKDFGATGKKGDDARSAIQKALEACSAAGGGTVFFPPGEYTSGALHLRSHVHLRIDEGATLFASQDTNAYDCGPVISKAALLFGENLEDISIHGRGTIDGQAEYEWRLDDFERTFEHKARMQALGKPLLRSFPKDFPKRQLFPHLIWLGQCKNVQVTGLKLLNSPSWTVALYDCERVRLANIYIYTSLKEGVWADGIDMDSCRNISISNCKIETGDDCVVFISTDAWGPPRLCENITVSNCILSSASAGVKFSEGNRLGVRNVVIRDTILTNVNRGFVFIPAQGGYVSDVLLSDLTIICNRFDWFWAGDGQPFYFRVRRISEWDHEPPSPGEPPPCSIRNISIRNIRANTKGSSLFHGHPENWLDGLTFENIKLQVSTDTSAHYDTAEHALQFRWARNLKIKNLEVNWGKPALENWKSALYVEDVNGLELDGFSGRAAWNRGEIPAIGFNKVSSALVRNTRWLDSTNTFLQVLGKETKNILLETPAARKTKLRVQLDNEVQRTEVKFQ